MVRAPWSLCHVTYRMCSELGPWTETHRFFSDSLRFSLCGVLHPMNRAYPRISGKLWGEMRNTRLGPVRLASSSTQWVILLVMITMTSGTACLFVYNVYDWCSRPSSTHTFRRLHTHLCRPTPTHSGHRRVSSTNQIANLQNTSPITYV